MLNMSAPAHRGRSPLLKGGSMSARLLSKTLVGILVAARAYVAPAAAQAPSVTDRGQIVGVAQTPGGELRAVMWEEGAITDLGSLGGGYSVAYSVNARGMACGFSNLATGESRAALYADGEVVDLGTLGGSFSQCLLGANSRQFVGASTIEGDAEYHAFVIVGGVMTDLNPQVPPDSGWRLNYAYGINERGQIVGGGHRDGAVPIRAFLLSRNGPHDEREQGDGEQ